MVIRLAQKKLQTDSIVDGEGLRAVLWTQGCFHHCVGCHNEETWDPNKGIDVELRTIFKQIDELEHHDGITLTGGDPLFQPKECSEIAKYAKSKGLNVWCYSGFTFESLLELSKSKSDIKELLDNIDVLIDGKFMLELKSFDCLYRGSTNQRIIDVQKSLKKDKAVRIEKYDTINRNNLYEEKVGMYC